MQASLVVLVIMLTAAAVTDLAKKLSSGKPKMRPKRRLNPQRLNQNNVF